MFEIVDSSQTGIKFNNTITENDFANVLNHVNMYNGGGVGIGDFNNDGLQDIYFTGNMASNKLYLNKGGMKFDDITDEAAVGGGGRWCSGVAVVDINNDGWMDMYVTVTLSPDSTKRENLLYINQGLDEHGIPHFKEMAAEYGLNDNSYSTMAYFFDYDNDGDLDVYILVDDIIPTQNPSKFRPIMGDGSHPSTGRLYRNNWNNKLKHGVFENVSQQAGITIEGYGLSAAITDINNDGWKDIYVANDFLSSNILYINNHDGTFTDRSKDYFKHTSIFAMGMDIQDINNDGLMDEIELDMDPPDNYRKKLVLGANEYGTYQNFNRYHYQYQYGRNILQLNQGPAMGSNDSIGIPVFSEIGYMSGISETDWSWTPLVTDFDNDGFRDIIVTNGYPRDMTNHDFMISRAQTRDLTNTVDVANQIPGVKLHNYAFKNNGDLTFTDVSKDWGLSSLLTFSNGAAYADLDNDGDMDIIINNINQEALIYRNNAIEISKGSNHFLNITFKGDSLNIGGIGAKAAIYYQGKQQIYEHTPYRGYLSSLQAMAHFGLGSTAMIDSVVILWPNFKKQILRNVKANQVLNVNIANATLLYTPNKDVINKKALFKEVTTARNINYEPHELDFVDFYIQKLLPHKLSEYNPALSVGDIDGNGLDDMICGGSFVNNPTLFFQQGNGQFLEKKLKIGELSARDKKGEQISLSGSKEYFQNAGLLLFDADGDGDLDLYCSNGGYEQQANTPAYQDRFYMNDGKGNFVEDTTALPKNFTSKSCVRAIDYDKDGDLDLFVGGRVMPWSYPKPVSSFIFRNDSKNGKIKFTDVTATVAKDLLNIGMVCDAVFSDFDNDGWPDLVIAGEGMPVTFLKNDHGIFKNVTEPSGTGNQLGWWNTIAPGDFDNDGDIDYIVGNVGLNSFYKASEQYPVYITSSDFDVNGTYDAFPSLFLPTSLDNPEKKEYPANLRADAIDQMASLRSKFPTNESYAKATMKDVLSPELFKKALRLKANTLASSFFRNDGNGKFTCTPLPKLAQLSVLNGILVDDFNEDGNLDILINGNDFGTNVSVGRYDAMNGLLMLGDGKGGFIPQSIQKSGIFIPGNGKALVQLQGQNGKNLVAASQHNGALKVFELQRNIKKIRIEPSDVSVLIKYKNGKVQKREFYYGYSFLSQSGRVLNINNQMRSLTITDSRGKKRDIILP
jgi:hypothetical protein